MQQRVGEVAPTIQGKSWANGSVLVEVVVLPSEGFNEDQEDAAAIGTDVGGRAG